MDKILVVSVHPDDETLGLGGSILKFKEENKKVFWLNITSGNKNQRNYIPIIEKKYNFDETFNLDFPEISLSDESWLKLIPSISEAINKIKCDTIFLPNRSDLHTDHQIAFSAIMACTKNFRNPFIKKILMYETLSETEFAPALPENVFIPNIFIDVSKYFEKKIEIMKAFETEIMENPYPRSLEVIRAFNKYRGSRIGVDYAESFMLLMEIL